LGILLFLLPIVKCLNVECGSSEKAVDASISAKEWPKALEILEVLERTPNTSQYYARIAEHFEAEGEYDVCFYILL
jgi:intraflagellar transport protein 172